MYKALFLILFGEPEIYNYVCTPQQLTKASEVYIPCYNEKHFQACYEASIREYCDIKVKD